jgi:hypothetical protein
MDNLLRVVNEMVFRDVFEAASTLRHIGFRADGDVGGLWRSEDGCVDAVIKERFRDNRYYVVFFG